MNDILLFTHSWLRWAVLLFGLYLVFIGFANMNSENKFKKSDDAKSAAFLGLFHLQLLIGLVLYIFTSPLTETAFSNFGAAMKNQDLRFWAVEHIGLMLIAAIVAQIGRIRIKKAASDKKKYRNMAMYYLISLILVLSRIPWDIERLFRGF